MTLDFPGAPPLGQIYPASNGINYQWDGDKWTTQINSNNSSIGSNPGPQPPANPKVGDFWFDTTNGQLYVRWDDGVNPPFWAKSSTPNAGYNMADLP